MTVPTQVRRECIYIHSGNETLFGWIHSPHSKSVPVTAIICNSMGVEYMSGHRSIRHLSEALAENGIESLRFDYAHTGDSSGGNFENASIAEVIRNIQDAVAAIKQRNHESCIALIGIGLGGTFAASACESGDIDRLIMWNPTVSGKRFVREQKLLSEVIAGGDTAPATTTTDVAGIVLTPTLQDEFKSIDLSNIDYSCVPSVLLVDRKDRKPNTKLAAAIQRGGTNLDHVSMPGYGEMMGQPTDTVVPVAVIEHICQWLLVQKNNADGPTMVARVSKDDEQTHLRLPSGDHTNVPLVEIPKKFGPNEQLFGIVSIRQTDLENTRHKRAFLFLNCGSEHHAGPHRMYTILARHCASFGYLSFRFDIEGIGDSFSAGNNEDNNSYSPVALHDIGQALAFLADEYGCTEFVLSGICAGAYHTFKATAQFAQFNIVDSNLINPLVYEWNYDDPDDHLKFEAHTYRKSIRDGKNWRRLVSGDINYARLARALKSYLTEFSTRAISRLVGFFGQRPAVGLPHDMREIESLDRNLTLLLSEGDPGLDIMRLQARGETAMAIKRGKLSTYTLHGANHGLSKKHMQDQLIDFFINKYGSKPSSRTN